MKTTAVLEFQRNRVRRQQSGAASLDIIKTIGQLRSALHGIGKAIEAVERLAVAQASEGSWEQRTSTSPKKLASKAKRKGGVVALPRLPEILNPVHGTQGRDDQPAVPDSAGAQT
jgi:hypothetical protein